MRILGRAVRSASMGKGLRERESLRLHAQVRKNCKCLAICTLTVMSPSKVCTQWKAVRSVPKSMCFELGEKQSTTCLTIQASVEVVKADYYIRTSEQTLQR